MPTELERELRLVAARTFEELAFLLPAEEMTPAQAALPMAHFVRVKFKGPFGGRLTLAFSEALLPLLAANMMGTDTEPTVTMQRDALKEAANVLCGNFLPAAYGKREIFHLDAPELLTQEEAAAGPAQAVISLGMEDGRCEVKFFREDEAK